jgi:transcriptional regulator with XRE-family HTH domain
VPSARAEKEILTRIGRNLQKVRVTAGLSQEALAERANLHPRTVQKIEAGDINILITTVIRLKAALRVDWNQLLGE